MSCIPGSLFHLARHVQISNNEALQFYDKFGFNIMDTKKDYYKRIEPADAYVLEKDLRKGGNEVDVIVSPV